MRLPYLFIRTAVITDADVLYRLWTDPRVMTHVGFPQGLRITGPEIEAQIAGSGQSVFDQYLLVQLKDSGESIGECKMIPPDADGLAETDVKLLPAFWGHKYGVEVKRGLLDYIFTHTDAKEVQATPNVNNVASIKMQEAVGGMRIGERGFEFPESMQSYTQPVQYYIYRVRRETWAKRNGIIERMERRKNKSVGPV
jgi:RimJ/RimL family protein N-acetyltransferase